jgi:uncharacterized membrane protein YeaQ/YmgE (transglycosylase-associated protein family)
MDAYLHQISDFFHTISEGKFFGVKGVTLAIWAVAGLFAGALVKGRRPLGLLGDLVVGLLGGFLGGAVLEATGFSIADHIQRVPADLTNALAKFITALVGAIVVLVVLRFMIRRAA